MSSGTRLDAEEKEDEKDFFNETFRTSLLDILNYSEREFRPKLFHYTDANGLKGILKSQSLWLTDNLFLNDSNEIFHGLDIAKEILSEKENDNTLDKSAREFAAFLRDNLSRHIRVFTPMTVSFCEDPDLLSQWHGYGKGKIGYSIGFDTNFLINEDNVMIFKVLYNAEQQKSILEKVIHRAMQEFQRSKISLEDINENLFIYRKLFMAFYCLALAFKDPNFEIEQEWRAAKLTIPGYDNIQTRISNDILIPFYEHYMSDVEKAIQHIIVGPSNNANLAFLGVAYLLNEMNLKNVGVYSSRIPYRRD
ncbi:DUF2971 domain-containing protein [Limimonas halophila]|uniref:DUF2971 domain-containing protein n=1 Tax=Limimonas halophila TaxID=1082479 RepID=UPI0015A0B849|nr:DUF2971 domain-containing protein [Limimonas halophila]